MSKTIDNHDDKAGFDQMGAQIFAPSRIDDNGFELMTESEVIRFLRIPEVSNSKDYHNVIEHLKKFRGLPRIHICRKALYPKKAILEWMEKETGVGK